MKLKNFSAYAVGMLLCVQITQAATIKESDAPLIISPLSKSSPSSEDSSTTKNQHIDDLSWLLSPQQLKIQLDTLQKVVPLTYNTFVQSYIDVYTSPRYKNHLSNMLELSKYYFPIYEKVFAETDVPQEIKYLSIIESALNPHAVSRVGATGPWQFMFATAKAFNLHIDNYIDERKDPYAASYAAAAYLKDAYNEFGDWQLAIASYNCGKGNVARAIQRTGLSHPDFWSVRPYLPQETRNYVPAFIAMTYVLSIHEHLGITPAKAHAFVDDEGTDVILIDKFIPLTNIARALNIEPSKLSSLNPAYKKNIVNGTPEDPKRLVVPAVNQDAYASLYAALQNPSSINEEVAPAVMTASLKEETSTRSTILYHKVKRGESLAKIANRYRVEVQDLKVWNNLRRNVVVPGQKLKIRQQSKGSAVNSPQQRLAASSKKKPSYITYTVRRGDTLSGIAQKYRGASVNSIKAANNLRGSSLKAGMTLKINRL